MMAISNPFKPLKRLKLTQRFFWFGVAFLALALVMFNFPMAVHVEDMNFEDIDGRIRPYHTRTFNVEPGQKLQLDFLKTSGIAQVTLRTGLSPDDILFQGYMGEDVHGGDFFYYNEADNPITIRMELLFESPGKVELGWRVTEPYTALQFFAGVPAWMSVFFIALWFHDSRVRFSTHAVILLTIAFTVAIYLGELVYFWLFDGWFIILLAIMAVGCGASLGIGMWAFMNYRTLWKLDRKKRKRKKKQKRRKKQKATKEALKEEQKVEKKDTSNENRSNTQQQGSEPESQ